MPPPTDNQSNRCCNFKNLAAANSYEAKTSFRKRFCEGEPCCLCRAASTRQSKIVPKCQVVLKNSWGWSCKETTRSKRGTTTSLCSGSVNCMHVLRSFHSEETCTVSISVRDDLIQRADHFKADS